MRTLRLILIFLFLSTDLVARDWVDVSVCVRSRDIFSCDERKNYKVPTEGYINKLEVNILKDRVEGIETKIIDKLDKLQEIQGEAVLNAARENLRLIIQEEVKKELKIELEKNKEN